MSAASRKPPGGEPPSGATVPSVAAIGQRLALDDFSGALALAQARLQALPGDAEARAAVTRCEASLRQMLRARLGGPEQRLRACKRIEELQWLSIDHRAGFLLSRIAGTATLGEVLKISGMSELDALRILEDLRRQQVIELVEDR
ncbi:MAG: hypothetical protein HY744_20600 [Deltaproteobacteria bacterium]|nr:hypothetical protein [Deltaproteobacteria bacterium]